MTSILIYRSLLFWLALMLPGYVVVRVVCPRDLKSGLLGTIAVSCLATWGLLSPVSILCYVLHAPVWVFSVACVLIVLWAVVEITRRRWWPDLWQLVVAGLSIALLIVVLDMIAGARVGTFVDGDARAHLARIRFLLDHGFNNNDPFVAAKYFFPTYHTNLHHAFYAACSQIVGLDLSGVWYTSLPWGKLLAAAGAYYMVWCIFECRWAASVAAVFVVGCQGPVTFMVYPNKLAPYWMIPVMIGSAAQACRSPCSWNIPLKLGIGSLVLGQTHGLYAAFAGLLMGPPLVIIALVKLLRRRPDRWQLVCCVAALGVAIPLVLVSKFGSRPVVSSLAADRTAVKEDGRFVHFDNGWVMHDPMRGFGRQYAWRFAAVAAGAFLALRGARRTEAGLMLAVVVTAGVVFYLPPVCSAVVRLAGKDWVLARMHFALYLGFVAFVPSLVVFLLDRRVRYWWVRSILTVLIGGIAIPYSWSTGDSPWPAYGRAVMAPVEERTVSLWGPRANAALLAQHVPVGSTVLTRASTAPGIVAIHDCYVVASNTCNKGVLDQPRRRADLKKMLAKETPWDERRALLRKYGVTHYVAVQGERLKPWLERAGTQAWKGQGFFLIALRTD